MLQRLFPSKDTTDLRDRQDALELGMRRLEEEWTEVYGKFRTLQMRVAKQVQRLEKDSSQEEPQTVEGEVSVGTMGTSLSPRAREIQKQILARRGRTIGGE